LAYEKPQLALRAVVRVFSGTFCPPLELLRNSFIAAVKTSHTTGTLFFQLYTTFFLTFLSYRFFSVLSSIFYLFFQKFLSVFLTYYFNLLLIPN
jgi:hypothetical protein